MIVEVKVPMLSESVSEATLLQWHKNQGEYVERDENLIDIETDKVVLELPAPESGVLASIAKQGGGTVVSNEVIATIDTKAKPPAGFKPAHAPQTPAKASALSAGEESASSAPAKAAVPSVSEGPAPSSSSAKAAMPSEASASARSSGAREEPIPRSSKRNGSGDGEPATRRAASRAADQVSSSSEASSQAQAQAARESTQAPVMPAARKLAAEKNIEVAQISGSGRGGRVTKEDVINRLQKPDTAVTQAKAPVARQPGEQRTGERSENRVAMSRLRARIAERLVQSQATTATLTTFNEVNMQSVIELRNRYKDRFEKEHGIKLGFLSFFVKAAVQALKKFPVVNASVDGNDIVYHDYYDIGIAVGTPRGLVVPILRNADRLSIAEIEQTIADFGVRAKDGKLSLEELTGGTFSISNGGIFGSMLSTPIINPPQSAILGIHATKERPVVENGQIVVRPMNYLALSYDHRIIDGREAVLSLVAIKEALEDPARMLLDL
jgi:2-oxoglutarate dehydrogenase E2 component (dihydrolipoamide succinyltransferase)